MQMHHRTNGKVHQTTEPDTVSSDILNPFVHRLELDTTYDKLKTAFLTVAVLPFRLAAITALVIMAWLLACLGLHGLTEDDLRRAPLTGWRRCLRSLVCWLMRALFVFGGFHHLKIKGQRAPAKDAPVLALAPHSSFFDALTVVHLGGPSVVAKAETSSLPFFGSFGITGVWGPKSDREPSPGGRNLKLSQESMGELTEINCIATSSKIIPWLCFLGRLTYQAGGMRIVVRGKQATRTEAPILVVAPHSTFIDGGIVYVTGFPSIIVRRESGLNPFIGKLINYTQPVYVWREDPNSRQNTIKEIIERATSKEDWPQVMIFPEGTCTNRSCLITFKSGAFYPGVPIQPVCIRYPNKLDTVTWTWEGPGALKLLWLTLTQLNSSCEIEFLPVYKPSEAEKNDPKLYANNVRRLMARALQIPVSDYTYDDCRIISKAHQLNLKHVATIIETHKLRYKLGLLQANTEEILVNNQSEKLAGMVDLREFSRILKLDEQDSATRQLFQIHDWNRCGKIDLQEYIFTVLVIATADSVEEMIKLAFKLCDSSGTNSVDVHSLRRILKLCLHLQREESDRIFRDSLTIDRTRVKLDDLIEVLGRRTEFAHLFAMNSEEMRKKST